MTPARLAERIRDLRYHTSAPYPVFIAETMRTIGLEVEDSQPRPEHADEVRSVVSDYLQLVTDADPFEDLLGPVYMEYTGGAQAFAGQFFTPPDVCDLMTTVMLGDWQPWPPPSGDLWTVYEPAAGSGAMLLSLYRTLLHRHGPEVLRSWGAVAWDLDLVVARTVAIQIVVTLARYGWAVGSIEVVHGNTLTQEVFGVVLHAVARSRESQPRSVSPAEPPTPAAPQFDLFKGRELVEVGR
jgi:hypothetical protein